MIGIYAIVNKVNGKIYIGQSTNIEYRWEYGHKWKLNNNIHRNEHLQNAWNKYGEENFEFKIIEELLQQHLNEKEEYWIKYYNSINPQCGYNLTSGGYSGYPTEEVRKKISNANKGRIVSEETRAKLSSLGKGKCIPEKTRRKISNSLIGKCKGKYVSRETREKLRIAYYNMNDESKRKLYKNRPDIHGDKNPMYGKHHSEESKEKIRNNKTNLYGEDNPNTKISEQIAKEIINMLLDGYGLTKISQKLDIGIGIVSAIKYKNTWKYLTQNIEFPNRRQKLA